MIAEETASWPLLVTCIPGLEKALGNEIRKLKLAIGDSGPGWFMVNTDQRGCLVALRCLRSAERVLVTMGRFAARDFDDYFEGIRSLFWEEWIPKHAMPRIEKVRLHRTAFTSIPSLQSIAQKAVFERLAASWEVGNLAQSDVECKIRIRIDGEEVEVFLDLCGDSLHHRTWRRELSDAPLRETYASAMLLLSGWKRKHPLVDPMCGSGTILIEALSYALNVAPNLDRYMAFEELPVYDVDLDESLREELRGALRTDGEFMIFGSDTDERAIRYTRSNLEGFLETLPVDDSVKASISSRVKIRRYDVHDLSQPDFAQGKASGAPFIVCNPPWGERLGTEEHALELCGELGRLYTDCSAARLVFISSLPSAREAIKSTPVWERHVRNGSIDTELFCYDSAGENFGGES